MNKKTTFLALLFINLVSFAQTFQEVGTFGNFAEDPSDFAMYNNYLFVGGGFWTDGALSVYNMQDPENPVFIEELEFPDFKVYDLLLDGTQLFVVGGDGLKIFDVSNPENINLLTTITSVIDGTDSRSIGSSSIAKNGNIIFVESGWSGLMSIDISDINNPQFLDLITYSGGLSCIVIYDNNTAFFADSYNIFKMDISNPSNLSKYSVPDVGDPNEMLIYNNKLIVSSSGTSGEYILVYNTNTLDLETEIKANDFEAYSSYGIAGMAIFNDTLVASCTGGLLFCEINNNYEPFEYYDITSYGTSGKDLIFYDDHIISNFYNQIIVYKRYNTNSVSDLNNDELVKIYPNPAHNQLTISNKHSQIENIEITDITGKIIKQFVIKNNESNINVSNLKQGIYITRIKMKEGIFVSRFIKE